MGRAANFPRSADRFRASRVVKLVAISGVLLAVSLMALEVMVRSLGWRPPGSYTNIRYENDPLGGPWALQSQVGFFQTPCFERKGIHINRFGMRDRERSLAKTGKRLALIGDSFTQGFQVADEETVSRQLETLTGNDAEVLNFGVSSTGTSVQLLLYRKWVRRFHPDVVLLMFFAGNDVSDNLPALKLRSDPAMARLSPYFLLDGTERLRETPEPGRWRRTSPIAGYLSYSALGQWAYYGYRNLELLSLGVGARAASVETGADQDRRGPNPDAELYEQAWRITEQVLLRLHREVTQDRARFGLVVIPSDFGSLASTGQVDSETATAIVRLQALARQAGFPLLDLTEAFRARVLEGDPTEFTYSCDGHWNAQGHAQAAAEIFRFLREQQWF